MLWRVGKDPLAVASLPRGAHGVAFSPDGGQLAAGGEDGIAHIWTTADLREVFATPRDPAAQATSFAIRSVAFLPDGARLLTTGGIARVWSIASREQLGQLRLSDKPMLGDTLSRGTFSNDGSQLLTIGSDQVARRWNARSYEPIDAIFVSGAYLTSIAPCGPSRAAVSQVIDAAMGKPTGNAVILDLSYDSASAFAGPGEHPDARVMAPDGGWYAAVEAERGTAGRLEHWDLRSRSHAGRAAAGEPVGRRRAPGRHRIRDRHPQRALDPRRHGHDRAQGRAGRRPAGGDPARRRCGTVRRPRSAVARRQMAHGACLQSANGKPAYASRVWDVAAGTVAHELPGGGFGTFFGEGSFGPEGTTVATVLQTPSSRYQVQIVDLTTQAPIAVLADGVEPLLSVTLSPRGHHWLVRQRDDLGCRAPKPITQLFGHAGAVWSAAFSPDGTRIATGGDDGIARLWGAATGAQLALYTVVSL